MYRLSADYILFTFPYSVKYVWILYLTHLLLGIGIDYNFFFFSELHHVHFEENGDTFGKDNEIIVQKTSDNKISVHLGFIQVNHRYSITFAIPKSLDIITKCSNVTIVEPAVPNKNLQIVSTDVNQDRIEFQIELFAYKEKLLKEEFAFYTSNDTNPVFLILNARVLGKY